MKDQDPLKSLKKEVEEDFCKPLQGEQKGECVNYYEKWDNKEEEPKDESE